MKFAAHVVQFDAAPDQIGPAFTEIVTRAERAGFDSLSVMDHFFQIPGVGTPEQPMLEGYAALNYAAGITTRLKLGTLVTGVGYRHPALLIKQVTTLDVLSGGRAYLGIGAGWYEQEHLGLGVPFPPVAVRFERLEETLQIAHQMWSGNTNAFHGRHYQLAEPINQPPALSRPHPPILVGGGGEQKTLRLVAQYADACNLFSFDLDQVKHKLEVLRRHCDAVGRPYDEIEKTSMGPAIFPPGPGLEAAAAGGFVIGPSQAIDQIGALRELGIDRHFVVASIEHPEMIDVIAAEVMPHFAREAVTA